ncbi:hypothetical protein WJX77_010648 [Trebouxia sp. C0004]
MATQVEVPATGNSSSAKRGYRGRGGGRGSPPGQSSQTRGRGSPPGQSSQPVFDENLHCATCNAVGHAKWTCPATNCE